METMCVPISYSVWICSQFQLSTIVQKDTYLEKCVSQLVIYLVCVCEPSYTCPQLIYIYIYTYPTAVLSGNLWVRKNASKGQSKLILYDWELSCLHVPQFDLAVFLLCTIPAMDYSTELYHIWTEHAEFYRHHLITSLHDHKELAEVFSDRQSFHRILGFVIFEAFCNRVSIWCILPPALRFYNSESELRKILSFLCFASKELPA